MRVAWRSLRLAHQSTAARCILVFESANLVSDISLRCHKIKSIINQSTISNNEEKMYSKLEKMDNSVRKWINTHT